MTYDKHITSTEKKSVKRIIEAGLLGQPCKIGRTQYQVNKVDGGFEIKIGKMGRGMGFYGEPLRFEVQTIFAKA
jgi:hypothetical protein